MDANDYQTIRQLFDDYLRMYASRDDRLTTYFSEDFSGFTGGGDFLVKDREEWVAITRQDFAQVKGALRIELKDLAIQSLADTIAVTTGFFIIHLPIKDHILSRETARLVLIFRKESAGWKISHSSISIPYYLVREGEVYPLKELVDRNQKLEELIAEQTTQLSEANSKLQRINTELTREIAEHNQAGNALQQSIQKIEAITSVLPDGIGILSLDGKIQFISDKLVKMHGYSIEQIDEFLGSAVSDFIDPSNHKLLIDNIRKVLAGESDDKLTEYLAIKKDNSRFNIDVNSTVLLDSDGNPTSILYVERDITERKRAEEALESSLSLLSASLESTADGILIVDRKGNFARWNQKFADMWEIPEEIISSRDDEKAINHILTQLADPEQFAAKVRKLYEQPEESSFDQIEFSDGRVFERYSQPQRIKDNIVGRVWSFRDITERKQAEEALRDSEERYRELSMIDDLTQLYNSRYFYVQLKSETERSKRYRQPLTLLLLDLDNFKAFNDAYGHVEGDQVLSRLGQVVKRCLRETDSAYRYGGEEFTILLPMTTSGEGVVTAERIRTEFRKEIFFPVPGKEVHMTVSIGLAQYETQEEMKAYVHRVDQLMYQGKKNGKDRVCSESPQEQFKW